MANSRKSKCFALPCLPRQRLVRKNKGTGCLYSITPDCVLKALKSLKAEGKG